MSLDYGSCSIYLRGAATARASQGNLPAQFPTSEGFLELGVTLWYWGLGSRIWGAFFGGVPIKRTIVYWGLCWGPNFGELPSSLCLRRSLLSYRAADGESSTP